MMRTLNDMETFTVHVLEARGKNSPVVQAALNLVQLSDGPVEFRYHEWTMPEPKDALPIDVIPKKIKDPYRFKANWGPLLKIEESRSEVNLASEKKLVPDPYSWISEDNSELKRRLEWIADDFYAATGADREHSMVVVLTTENNENNYFAVPDLFGKQWSFIQSNHPVTKLMAAPHLPIAYELLAMPLRHFAFGDLETFTNYLHINESIGCLNDFFANLREMDRKLKSADICDRCLGRIRAVGVPYALLRQTQEGLERIRVYQQNLRNLLNDFELPKLELGYHLKISNTGSLIQLAPKQLAVYALFAEHPEGIRISHVPDHLNRLDYWYRKFNTRSSDDSETIDRTVRSLAFNDADDLSQTISKLNRKIRASMSQVSSAEPYLIQGPNGEAKKIAAAASNLINFAP
ncbi:MAG: hypothetical protein RLZZ261_354 [Bacteroidota bacterium]|jgi:hypothetical protein